MSDIESKKLQRRALVKAVAAAPVVFTLPSGAALATTSLTCADKSKLDTNTPRPRISTTTDKWVRYRVEKISFVSQGQKIGFVLNNNYYSVASGVATLVTGNISNVAQTGQHYYLLVDYDAYKSGSSVIASAYPADSSITNPIAGGSCWASLTGVTPNPGNFL